MTLRNELSIRTGERDGFGPRTVLLIDGTPLDELDSACILEALDPEVLLPPHSAALIPLPAPHLAFVHNRVWMQIRADGPDVVWEPAPADGTAGIQDPSSDHRRFRTIRSTWRFERDQYLDAVMSAAGPWPWENHARVLARYLDRMHERHTTKPRLIYGARLMGAREEEGAIRFEVELGPPRTSLWPLIRVADDDTIESILRRLRSDALVRPDRPRAPARPTRRSWTAAEDDDPRPADRELNQSRRDMRFTVMDAAPAGGLELMDAWRSTFFANNADVLSFDVDGDDTAAWFWTRSLFDEYQLATCLLFSEAINRVRPELAAGPHEWWRVRPPSGNVGFVDTGSADLAGQIAGKMRSIPYSWETGALPEQLGVTVQDAVIGERTEDFSVAVSLAAWSGWFINSHWNASWLIVDRMRQRVHLICTTAAD